jgi:hypothetical protein
MKLQTKIKKYINEFETKQRDDRTSYTYLKDRESEMGKKLDKALFKANGEGFPRDDTFTTFLNCLLRLQDFEIETMDDIENNRGEIVDGLVDMYTANLTKWLESDIKYVYYLTEAIQQFDPRDGVHLLSTAQYLYIDEIMQEVINLLEGE